MAIKILVVDMTGDGRPGASIYIEGKILHSELRAKALNALGYHDSELCVIEVKDENGIITTKISSRCTIFVKYKNVGFLADILGNDPLGLGNIFNKRKK